MPITSNLLVENNLPSRRLYSSTSLLFKLCALKQIVFIQTESCRFTPVFGFTLLTIVFKAGLNLDS